MIKSSPLQRNNVISDAVDTTESDDAVVSTVKPCIAMANCRARQGITFRVRFATHGLWLSPAGIMAFRSLICCGLKALPSALGDTMLPLHALCTGLRLAVQSFLLYQTIN